MQPLITDPAILSGYLTDASNVAGRAEGLVRPHSAEEVAEVVAHCQRHAIPLTVTAKRTSTTAAAVPRGGWLLSMEHLDAIEVIEHDRARAQAGVVLGQLQDAIEATGRFFPPDPTSRYDCSLGGAIACNASGARSFRYGPTRPWIEALQVVLPDGQLLEVGPGDPLPPSWPVPRWSEPSGKTAAGYAPPSRLLDVFIGQEGTLGVVTAATLRLTDLHEAVGMLLWFVDRAGAVSFMRRIRELARADAKGLVAPRCIEYLDAHCVDLARGRVGGVPTPARAALFVEQELHHDADDHLAAWWELLESSDALADDTVVAADDAGRAQLHALRHAIPAGINERVVHNGMRKVGTDLAVPDDALEALMDAYEAAPIEHVLFGHLGDNHLHLNLLPKTEEELVVAKRYYDDLARQAVAAGGTVSAEHGIGKLKREHLGWMVGDDVLASFAALKRALDPAWILGRGNVLKPPASPGTMGLL